MKTHHMVLDLAVCFTKWDCGPYPCKNIFYTVCNVSNCTQSIFQRCERDYNK